MDFSKLSDRERLIAEQAVETLRALDRGGGCRPARAGVGVHGSVYPRQGFWIDSGDDDIDRQRPFGGAKKGVCIRPCSCGGVLKFKQCQPRTILTTVGHITFARRRYHCRSCGAGVVPLDQWGGVGQRSLTIGASRMVTLAGVSWSFDRASAHLEEFCHLRVSDDTIERVCQEQGERAKGWMEQSPEPVKAFEKAVGQAEFSTDGVKINTTGGWREMRLSVLAKREPAVSCEPWQWDERVLNDPTVRISTCRIADADHVGASWSRLSRRMNLRDQPLVNVLADGAKWIWDQAGKRLPKHNGKWCVDVYHVSQHLHQCGRELFGEGPNARVWAQEKLKVALEHNGPALIERVESEAQSEPEAWARRKSLESLLTFLRPNRDRMWYRERLAAGQPIGSGLIEGGCKNTIGARLKLNNARWRIRRAERMGLLRCLDASAQWSNFWLPAA